MRVVSFIIYRILVLLKYLIFSSSTNERDDFCWMVWWNQINENKRNESEVGGLSSSQLIHERKAIPEKKTAWLAEWMECWAAFMDELGGLWAGGSSAAHSLHSANNLCSITACLPHHSLAPAKTEQPLICFLLFNWMSWTVWFAWWGGEPITNGAKRAINPTKPNKFSLFCWGIALWRRLFN